MRLEGPEKFSGLRLEGGIERCEPESAAESVKDPWNGSDTQPFQSKPPAIPYQNAGHSTPIHGPFTQNKGAPGVSLARPRCIFNAETGQKVEGGGGSRVMSPENPWKTERPENPGPFRDESSQKRHYCDTKTLF